ncbi:MAG TPA: RHS repeat-associated core domain-containing protein [Terriglobales bacterium]|nr:RHS repeat-associated core domain-containing protein [Terriglobales bacterium]
MLGSRCCLSILDGATYSHTYNGVTDNINWKQEINLLNSPVTEGYGYDSIYQLLSGTRSAGANEAYTYDSVGDRTTSASGGSGNWNYNSSNQLTSRPGVSYGYDSDGNVSTSIGSAGTTNFNWDFENRLTSVAEPGSGGTVAFKYDPFGRRIYRQLTSSGSNYTFYYVYDGATMFEQLVNLTTPTLDQRWTFGPGIDEPLSTYRSGVTYFFESDGLGTVTSLTGSSGAVGTTYTYDSFGNQTGGTGTWYNRFRYTGRENDSETGLSYLRARYYDPVTGRFISEDPIGFGGGQNFYRYVANNPVNLVDPNGTQEATAVGTEFCVLGPWGCAAGVGGGLVIDGFQLLAGAAVVGGIANSVGKHPAASQVCKKMTKDECWERYLSEKAFCSRYYKTPYYSMCVSRALARYEACRDGLDPDNPGPLDPLEWPDAPPHR